MVDQMTLAFDLIERGYAVFPVNPATKHPYTTHGHLDASRDVEEVAVWFSVDYPGAVVGVHAGASGLVILDLDKKNGKDGFESVEDGWLEIPESFHYDTPSGGRHYIYVAPEGSRLAPARDYRGLSGVDRRGGSSYAVWYGEAPADGAVKPAPKWLCDEAEARVGSSFDGELDDWLNSITDGDPDGKVITAMQRIPNGEFDHVEMVERQMELVRLAAEGHPGVKVALSALRNEWLRDPYNTDDYAYEYDSGLYGCVKKFGATDAAITELPEYSTVLAQLPEGFPIGMLVGEPKPKKHLFDVLRVLVATEFDDYQVAAILWGAPTVKAWAREWGLQYLYQQIAQLRTVGVAVENPTLEVEHVVSKNVVLLDDMERDFIAGHNTFVERYVAWVRSRTKNVNVPYHRMNAYTILSLAYGMYGFIPEAEGAMGLNLFQIGLGESSTGKTRSLKLRDAVLRELFTNDPAYDLGSDASIQALHDVLLQRDGKQSFFNADEAAVTFSQMVEQKWLSGMESFLTRLYEGYVPPMLRRGSTESAKPAMTSFNVCMYGTPDRVLDILNEDMFLTGFLPRFVWVIGDPPDNSDEQHRITQSSERLAKLDYDPVARAFATEVMVTKRIIGAGRHPVRATDAALERMAQASKDMKTVLEKHPLWRLIEPSWKRLATETVRKASALLALSEGTAKVELRHVLYVLSDAELWVNNLVHVAEGISASAFQKECDDVERFVVTAGGAVSKSKLVNRFRSWRYREFAERLESLIQQGRLREDQTGTRVEVNV